MRKAVLGSESVLVIFDQAILDQVLALLAHRLECWVIEVELALDNILDDLWFRAARERNLSGQHDVKDYSHAPNVDFHVIFLKEDLWRNVIWRARHGVHCVLLGEVLGQPKVYHLNASHIILLVKHEIFWLDISMGDLLAVQVVERREQLLHDKGSHFFRKIFLVDDVVKQFTTLAVLKYKEADLVPLPDLVQLNDVWMILC